MYNPFSTLPIEIFVRIYNFNVATKAIRVSEKAKTEISKINAVNNE